MLFTIIFLLYSLLLFNKKIISVYSSYMLLFIAIMITINIALSPNLLNSIYFVGAVLSIFASLTIIPFKKEYSFILMLKSNYKMLALLLIVTAVVSALATYLL